MDKLTIRDADVAGKRVFVRVDYNVPLADGKVTDDSRIRASIPTITALIRGGASVILASHLGRPDGKVQDSLRLRPVGQRLTELLRRNVPVTGDALGVGTEDAVKRLRPGELLLLENLRFHPEEEKNDPAFAAALAEYADIYVNDAFGTAHRPHSSVVGVQLPQRAAGFLMKKELDAFAKVLDLPKRPLLAILGGAKVADKIQLITHLIDKADELIIGGGMAYTFLNVINGMPVGESLLDSQGAAHVLNAALKAQDRKVPIHLPTDFVIADRFAADAQTRVVSATEGIPAKWQGLDCGPESIKQFTQAIGRAHTMVWNGPMGRFEWDRFAAATKAIMDAVVAATQRGAVTVIGGGDTATAAAQWGADKKVSHCSTGGGASLELLEGKTLPGVAALSDA